MKTPEGAVPEAELVSFMDELAATESDPELKHPTSSTDPAGILGAAWERIRAHHPELPEVTAVVIPWAEPSWRPFRFLPGPWPMLRATPAALTQGPTEILLALLHQAAHALGVVYGVTDTSRQGRWHNRRFLALATEVALAYPWDGPSALNGFGDVRMSPLALSRYQDVIELLANGLRGDRR